jgi:ribonucleoside-diphosphate reductase alpha chain
MESFSNTSPSQVLQDFVSNDNGRTEIIRKVLPGDLHTCNLCSVNMAFTEDAEMEDVCATSVRILDNLIDFTTAPVQEGLLHNNKYRTIGVGFMGYADYTVKKNIPYTASEELADEVFEKIAYYCTKASMELAKDRGSFDSYEKSEFKKGIILGKNKAWFQKNSKMAKNWLQLIDDISQYGIRNSQITAIAPNSSTSLLQGCTASILPIFGKFYMDNGKTTVPITPPFIKNNMWVYQENKNIDQRKVIDVVSKIQKWIDTGISMELILNPNHEYVNAKYLLDLITQSWEKECKTIYYIRSIQSNGEIDKGEEDCVSCAN